MLDYSETEKVECVVVLGNTLLPVVRSRVAQSEIAFYHGARRQKPDVEDVRNRTRERKITKKREKRAFRRKSRGKSNTLGQKDRERPRAKNKS